MASTDAIDFEMLLAPIPGENPAGSDLRADPSPVSDYHTIRDARKAASAAERRNEKGDDGTPGWKEGTPDWKAVVDRGTAILAGKSKDLEVAAYLIEGMLRQDGFAGLRDGFRLARGLVEGFWDTLYPDPGGTDYESRFSTVLWLSGIDRPGTLIVPVRKIPFTAHTGAGCYNLSHLQLARSLEQVADVKVRQKRVDDGAVTLEGIRKAVSATPAAFYIDLLEGVRQSREEFLAFCAAFSERSGFDPPGTDLLEVLEAYHDDVADLARDKLPKAAPPPPPVENGNGAIVKAEALPPARADLGVIRDRVDALNRLKNVADYFRENEPQSIIPYALEQVIEWGKMSLPDLLSELIPEGPRKDLFKQVGIRTPDPKK